MCLRVCERSLGLMVGLLVSKGSELYLMSLVFENYSLVIK